MKNQLTLLHFDNAEDLLGGISTLQQHRIAICEVYSAEPISGIKTKLGIKQLQLGETIFRFGCLAGMALTPLSYYFLEPLASGKTVLLNVLILLVTLIVANLLFTIRAPRLFTLKPNDRRYLAVVNTRYIPVNETVAHLFRYTGAIELNPALKNILLS